MRKIILLLLISFNYFVFSQSVEKKYYTNGGLTNECLEKEARFVKVITEQSGHIDLIVHDNEKNKDVKKETYLNGEPISIWISLDLNGNEEILDYNFDLQYSENVTSDELPENFNRLRLNDSLNYIPPKTKVGSLNIYNYLNKIDYPLFAVQNKIEGRVVVQCIIRKDKKVDLTVLNSVHKTLDKESMRLFKNIEISEPAKLNGNYIDIVLKIPVNFRLE